MTHSTARLRRTEGWTLIETLFVIIIIGILCMIAIPLYLQQRDKAKDAAARESGRTLAIACKTYQIADKDGEPPPDASKATLVAASAIDAADWPPNGYTGDPIASGTGLGEYTYQLIDGGANFEITLHMMHGLFLVP